MFFLCVCPFSDSSQVGFGELPFNRIDLLPTYPDICFRVDGYNFLCHKVQTTKFPHHSSDSVQTPTHCPDPVTMSVLFSACLCVCVSRRFSVGAVITLKPYWRTTSVRESSFSHSPAPQWSLCTTSPMKSSSTSCITSTVMTQRFEHNLYLKFESDHLSDFYLLSYQKCNLVIVAEN